MKRILEEFEKAKRIVVTAHVNPDGDCIGAGLALFSALNNLNSKLEKEERKVIRFILQDTAPKNTSFLEHFLLIEKYENINTKYDFDLMFIVDCGDFDRIGQVKNLVKDGIKIINIDHHESNNNYGDISYVDKKISSTSELIFNILKELNLEINIGMGEAIYTGILNDTGNFSYTNVSKDTFRVASELREIGINNEKIIKEFYDKKTKERLRMLGYAMSNFEFYENKKLTYVFIPHSVYENYGASREDSEEVVEALRSFEKTEVALFLREESNGLIKGSMRSNGIDVNKIASNFGGGGHIKASGFTTDKKPEEVLEIVLNLL